MICASLSCNVIIGLDNAGLALSGHYHDGLFLMGALGTSFNKICVKYEEFYSANMCICGHKRVPVLYHYAFWENTGYGQLRCVSKLLDDDYISF